MDNLKKLDCEEALLMMSRHLDGDLNKSEIGQFHQHAVHCCECQGQMEEMSAVELELAAHNESFDRYSLDEQFNAKIKASIAMQAPPVQHLSLWQRLLEKKIDIFKPLTGSRFFPMGVGVLASFMIFAIIWPQLQTEQSSEQSPITLVDVPFEQTQPAKWNHEKTIPPGQSVQIVVQQGDGKSYLLRMSSSGPVKMNVRHDNQNIQQVYAQQMVLNGLLYATVKATKNNKGVIFQNNGKVPIQLSAHSYEPQAIQMNLKNSNLR
ncbi:MAG: hypothetical protein HQM13_16830 [SAR324 cluster bacterium]|nr:hypothetical protein [SAR324 cluster bacterium]